MCTNSYVKEDAINLGYTQNQRRKELKTKKYNKIRNKIRKKDAIDIEKELLKYTSKSLIINENSNWIKIKFDKYNKLSTIYNAKILRKLRLQSHRNKLKSEQLFMNKVKKKYGLPHEVVACFGDWNQKRHMKFKEPTIGIGLRKMFRREGYKTYLVDEVFYFNILFIFIFFQYFIYFFEYFLFSIFLIFNICVFIL